MRHLLPILLVLVLAAISRAATPHAPSSTHPAEVTSALNAGKALALIEVTAVKEQDFRPSDGALVDIVSFKIVKSSGTTPADIRIIKAFGGLRPPGTPEPVPGGILFADPLVAGQRYWVIFNNSDPKPYPQGVVAWWPEKSAPTAALDAAVAAGKFGKPTP